MSVHYKFKSNLDHDTVTFDGLSISVADLKKAIMHQKKIGKSSDFDLEITNAQTREVYDNDEMLVPKNSSIIVSRVPVQGGTKKNWDKPDLPLPLDDDDLGSIRYDRIAKNADLVNSNHSEEDKVKAMITQSSQEYDPSKYVKSRSMTGPLPPAYTCYRCGKQGHWIKNCPTNNPDVKRSTGIPRSFMVQVDGPEHKGALLTSSGDYAVPLIDHQAYKEVKKEKPPFVPQEEPKTEPDAELPDELLCRICKDLLQDAVLIPCCGNSFCDECVRQFLLESEDHKCPECFETDVSPNNLIPNRFLRTAVHNYKNEVGYSRIKRVKVDSPQHSPDSTVASQSHAPEHPSNASDTSSAISVKNEPAEPAPATVPKEEKIKNKSQDSHTPDKTKDNTEDDSLDARPGTPLADEPSDSVTETLPIQTIGQEPYHSEKFEYSSRYSRHRSDYRRRYEEEETQGPRPISTIGSMAWKTKFPLRSGPIRNQFSNQRPMHRDGRQDSYMHDRDDYHARYDKRHHSERDSRRPPSHYDKLRESRYPPNAPEYPPAENERNEYEPHPHREDRHQDRYRSPPHAMLLPPPPVAAPLYAPPVAPLPPPHPAIIPPPPVFATQPPPPGASPITSSHISSQPPPPGVGPLLPMSTDTNVAFAVRPYETEDRLKSTTETERSIDDRMEEFQRKLEKKHRDFSRDRASRSRSRSKGRHRTRSSSRSRSYSKSWSRSPTRSSSRSRSRTPFTSRSRTRSFSPSRSRSWSKKRSYTRSRSRTRTESRSRSRSRNESRMRRRGFSRDRPQRSPIRTRSRSFSPRNYRGSSHRAPSFYPKRGYSPPPFSSSASYQSTYGQPPSMLPIPVMRPPSFPPHHLHSVPIPIQPIHASRPLEQNPIERHSKFPYEDQFPVYGSGYKQVYHSRYDREAEDRRSVRYGKRGEFERHPTEVPHRIPGWVGDGSREYKRQRYQRDPRGKEIKELPQIPETDPIEIHSKVSVVEQVPEKKKREEKMPVKHKRSHHKNKESKVKESKISVVISRDQQAVSKSSSATDARASKKTESADSDSKHVKASEKTKEKKHKHKRHKVDASTKKRKVKKEKIEGGAGTDSDLPKAKTKKKRTRSKPSIEEEETIKVEQDKKSAVVEDVQPEIAAPETVEEQPPVKAEEPATLDIFADDDLDPADVSAESVAAPADEGTVTEAETVVEETEAAEESAASDLEEEMVVEEMVEDESVLRVDMPGISKWEREESDEEEAAAALPQRRSSVVVAKEEKGVLSSDIISRAENALLSKQFKPRLDKKETADSKLSSDDSSRDTSTERLKEKELKSVVSSEPLKPPSLKVTISNGKDKRSVFSRKDEGKSSKSESHKRDRHERSIRVKEESGIRRTVSVHVARPEDKIREHHRDRVPERRERRYSPHRDIIITSRHSSRDSKEFARRSEREYSRDDDFIRREERKRRFEEPTSSRSDSRDGSDRKRLVIRKTSPSRSKRTVVKEVSPSPRRIRKMERRKRSESRSSESEEGYTSSKKVTKHSKSSTHRSHREEQAEAARRKHSPIKAPSEGTKTFKRDFHDELKFEPDYDEFSDAEEKAVEKSRKRLASPEVDQKSIKIKTESSSKVHRADKSSATSSVSSSEASESDSDDSEDAKESRARTSESDHKKHKKSKHKKHKKHHKKHKKKKSHKTKRD